MNTNCNYQFPDKLCDIGVVSQYGCCAEWSVPKGHQNEKKCEKTLFGHPVNVIIRLLGIVPSYCKEFQNHMFRQR